MRLNHQFYWNILKLCTYSYVGTFGIEVTTRAEAVGVGLSAVI